MSSEEMERQSNGVGKVGREYRMSRGSNYSSCLLFGSESVAEGGLDDLNELREEDVWGEEEVSSGEHLHQRKDTCSLQQNGCTKGVTKGRRSWLSMEMQAAGGAPRKEQCGVGLAALEAAQNSYGVNGGGGGKSGGWVATGRMNVPQNGISGGWQGHEGTMQARKGVTRSAPMSVPVWAKCCGRAEGEEKGKEGEDAEERLIPPHEIVAREYARSQSATFSVFEGTGRTLKGMDLRRVRNAVWRRTGFVD